MKQRFNGGGTVPSNQPGGERDMRTWATESEKPNTQGWLVALLGITGLSAAAVLLLQRRHRRNRPEPNRHFSMFGAGGRGRRHGHRRPSRPGLAHARSLSETFAWDADGVDIGAVLGVDIGGTLSKLVYFEKKAPSDAQPRRTPSQEDPMGKKVRYTICVRTYSVLSVLFTV